MGENGMGQAMAGLGVGVRVYQDLGHPARFSDLGRDTVSIVALRDLHAFFP